ncbi:MAG TPA: hypothetical protein VH593_04590 [Ktedonobacteraceae bacterium]|jgi:hypothetical protein
MNSEREHMNDFQRKNVQDATPSPLHCASCDIEILWPPVIAQGRTYCCAGCAAGGPCSCDYSQYHAIKIAGVIHYDGLEKPQ